MSAQIIPFPWREAVIKNLKAAEAELLSVVVQEDDDDTAADLYGVIEKLEEIVLKLSN